MTEAPATAEEWTPPTDDEAIDFRQVCALNLNGLTCPLERRATLLAGRICRAEAQMRSLAEYVRQLKRAQERLREMITAQCGEGPL